MTVLYVALPSVYNSMIGTVLNSMLGHISLPNILQKIIQVTLHNFQIGVLILLLLLLQDPSYQFKDIKQLIMGMLETYNYEEVV